MFVLGAVAGTLALIFLLSLARGRRLAFPDALGSRPASLEKLPPEDLERIEAWGRALEAQGFRRIGDFRLDIELGRGLVQGEQKRVWLSADATTWAAAKHTSVLNPAMEGVARGWRLLGFTSRLPSGGLITTHNSPMADNSFLRDPESSSKLYPGVEDVGLLLEAHARHLKERGAAPAPADGDLLAFERETWARTTSTAEAQGYFVKAGGLWRATLKLALVSTLRGFNPARLESGRPAAVFARLLGLAAGTAVAEALLLGGGAPPWATAFPFVAAALYAGLHFPQSALFGWIYAVLPAHVVMMLHGAPPAWAWLGGGAALILLMRPLEARRYRRMAEALSRPDAGPPPLTRRARIVWTVAFGGTLVAAAALLAWIRAPKTITPPVLLAFVVLALGAAGLLLVDVVADFLPSLRRTDARRILKHLARCALLLLLGVLGGAWLASRDEAASAAAAKDVVAALERFRIEKGVYPASLTELGPLPAPRAGWGAAAFRYAGPPLVGRPDWFTLTWDTAKGPAHAWPGWPTP